MFSALAPGASRIRNVLQSADVRSTAHALRMLGAPVPEVSSAMVVGGTAPNRLRAPAALLDCGNSGTTARLMAGVVAGAGLTATFVGDASLARRPMRRVAEPLRAMGARVELADQGGLPMVVYGGPLRGIRWRSPVASAQVKSAVLLAALLGGVEVTVQEPHHSRDHTERMLRARGIALRLEDGGTIVTLPARQSLRPLDVDVPADPSSAAFFVALAVLAERGELTITDVCLNETRTGFFDILRSMGADIELVNRRESGGEVVGSIVARPSRLRGVAISPEQVPGMIDELPLFACVAARAEGESSVRGAGELRVKESDRIATVVSNLRRAGAEAEELPDGFRVTGAAAPLRGRVTTSGDHRIAMAFGILGAAGKSQIEVDDPECVGVSYPDFWRDLERVTS